MISIIALFVALGGTGYAAITVTGKNVKNNSLTGKDVKKDSLTGKDVKNLKGADVASDSLTGADVSESSLAKVPSASSADSAGNSNTVGGVSIKKFVYRTAAASATQQDVFSLGGLTLKATCSLAGPEVVATTSVDDALIHSLTMRSDLTTADIGQLTDSGGQTVYVPGAIHSAAYEGEEDDFDTGETFELDGGEDLDSDEGQLTYTTPAGGVVHAEFASEVGAGPGTENCDFAGIVYSG